MIIKTCLTCLKPIVKKWPYLIRKAKFCSAGCMRHSPETKGKISLNNCRYWKGKFGPESAKWFNYDKKAYNRSWQKAHPDLVNFYALQYYCRKCNAEGSYTLEEWLAIKGPCKYCGAKERIEADHIVPLSKGGKNDISNIQPLCRSCNARKSARLDYVMS